MQHYYNRHVRRVKTVKIVADNDLGFMIINEVDFDPDRDRLFESGPVETEGGGVVPEPPAKPARPRKPRGKRS